MNAAWANLNTALKSTDPACVGDDRFIIDLLTERDRMEMRGLCRVCPLRALCEQYTAEAKPTGGFWAGRSRQGRGER